VRSHGDTRRLRTVRTTGRARAPLAGLVGVLLLATALGPPAAAASCQAGRFDVDLDGYADTVIGAPQADVSGAADAGRVTVLRGGSAAAYGSPGFDLTAAALGGAVRPGERFGASLAIGDFTGDGCADLAIGSPGANAGAGAVHVVDLSTSARTAPEVTVLAQDGSGVAAGPERGDGFGTALAVTPGRVRDSLWVGAPGEGLSGRADAGAVTSFGVRDTSGALGGDRYDWRQADFGGTSEAGDRFGQALAGGATVLAVGAPGEDLGSAADAGVVGYRLRSGAARQVSQSGSGAGAANESGDQLGASVAVVRGCRSTGEAVVAGAPGEDVGRARDAGLLVVTDLAAPTASLGVTQQTSGVDGAAETSDRFGYALAPTTRGVVVGVPGEKVGSAPAAGLIHDLVLSCTSAGRPRVSSGRALTQASPGFAGANEAGDHLGRAVGLTSWTTGSGRRSAAVAGLPSENPGSTTDAGAVALVPFTSSGTLTASGSRMLSRGSGAPGAAQAGERLSAGVAVSPGGRSGTVADPGPFRLPGTSVGFPVGVSADRRSFVDGTGSPWFGTGDTAWSLLAQLSPAEIDTYLTDRAGRGINLVLANVLEHYYADHAPNNYADQPPFTGTPFQSAPNEAYWRVVDHAVRKAESLGVTLLLCPAYLGYPTTDEGWGDEVAQATTGDLADYGAFLAARYGSAPNVMWLIGHDRVPSTAQKARMEALAAQLPADDLVGLGASAAVDVLGARAWAPTSIAAEFETIYSYSPDPAAATAEGWSQAPVRPVLFLEGRYEQEGDFDPGDERLRHQMYGPFAAGASAVLFGNNPIWHFESTPIYPFSGTWQQNLSSLGSRDLGTFGVVVASLPWAATVPVDPESVLVSGSDDAVVRASGQAALVYLPTRRAVTVDLSRFAVAEQVRVVAVDPRSGADTVLGTFPTAGRQALAARPANAAGTGDWVLVITAAG
jgi:hypothetical protein